MKENYPHALAFFWAPGRDNPADGYHSTTGDPGGGTLGGVTEGTWASAKRAGFASGKLSTATDDQLSGVLHAMVWDGLCDELPGGIDLLVFNGRGLTGMFPKLLQMCLGFTGDDVDGEIGPMTRAVIAQSDHTTLIHAVTGVHYNYLTTLSAEFPEFGKGWTARLLAARDAALLLVATKPA